MLTVLKKFGNKIYIGGDFRNVNHPVTKMAIIDTGTAKLLTHDQKVIPNQIITCVISDNSGGWYIGGEFTKISGVPRKYFAKINPDGTLNAWNPNVNGTVYSMVLTGNILYLAGKFSKVNNQPRKSVAALDVNTGALLSFSANVDNKVYKLKCNNAKVYIQGDFKKINGINRIHAAALDSATGNLTNWYPNNAWAIRDFDFTNNKVYCAISSPFCTVNLYDTILGTTLTYNAPNWDETYFKLNTIKIVNNTVLIGGFENSSQLYPFFKALDINTGAVSTTFPTLNFIGGDHDGGIYDIEIVGNNIYVAGTFHKVNTVTINSVAKFDLNGNLLPWNAGLYNDSYTYYGETDEPSIGGVSVSGMNVFVFDGYYWPMKAAENVKCKYLASYDTATGEVTPVMSNIDYSVSCMDVDDNNQLYIGGEIHYINNQSRNGLACINLSTGQLTPFNPQIACSNGYSIVNSIKIVDSNLFIGGDFNSISNVLKGSIACVNKNTGQLLPLIARPTSTQNYYHGIVYKLDVVDNKLIFSGDFDSINGAYCKHLAIVDATTGNLFNWSPQITGYVDGITHDSNTIYLGGLFDSIAGYSRKNLAAIDINSHAITNWHPSTNNDVIFLDAHDNNILVGGRFDTIENKPIKYIAKVDKNSGNILGFNPFKKSPAQSYIGISSIINVDNEYFISGAYNITNGVNGSMNFTAMEACPDTPTINIIGNSTICQGNAVKLFSANTSVQPQNTAYQWKINGVLISGATDSIYITSVSGNYLLAVSGSSVCTIKNSSIKTITVNSSPTATFTFTGPLTFCSGGSITFTAPSVTGYSYAWYSNGVKVGAGPSKSFNHTGDYVLVAKLGSCTDTTYPALHITVHPLPVSDIFTSDSTNICFGDSTKLEASPSVSGNIYQWVNNGNVIASTTLPNYEGKVAGTYKVVVTDNNGCVSKASTSKVALKTIPLPNAVITPMSSLNIGTNGNVKLKASPATGVSIQWYLNGNIITGATNSIYQAFQGGNYTVSITKNSCSGWSSPTTVVQLLPKITNGVTNINGEFELSAYPNPVSDVLTITVVGLDEVNGTIQLMDFSGKLILNKAMNEPTLLLEMKDLSSGIYFIRYKDDEGRTGTLKVVKE
jgi:hypothetical protein